MADNPIERRRFLVGAGTAVAAGLAADRPTPAAAQDRPAVAAPAPAPEPTLVLTATEADFVAAAADTIIPADELSPSGSECGIVTFIDRQLASAWGGGAKMYRGGPFVKGKPEQGYQLPLTPLEFFQVGIAEANAWSVRTNGKKFDLLSPTERANALKAMEDGKADFHGLPSRAFFAQCPDHAGVLLGPDLLRQPQQSILGDAWLPRTARDLCRQDRRISRQTLHGGTPVDRRFQLGETQHDDEIERSRRGHGGNGLDRRDHGARAFQGWA